MSAQEWIDLVQTCILASVIVSLFYMFALIRRIYKIFGRK